MYKDKIQERISKCDNQLIYISGYENCYSKIRVKCLRCGNEFERVYNNVVHKEKGRKYHCPICQTKLGLERSKKNKGNIYVVPLQEREKQFIQRLSLKNNTIKYISGYVNSDKFVLLECSICGYRFQRKAQVVRGNNVVVCSVCKLEHNRVKREQNRIIRTKIKQQQEYLKNRERERVKELKHIYKNIKDNTIHICSNCNKEFVENTISYRCARCRNKKRGKHSYKSLMKLYERDKGICHICKGKCDYEDYVYRGNTFIAGNYYPSIDHVIPLSKGGTDSWDNIKLAHFKCNLVKGDKGGI